jgi:acyl-CoA synthetase (AMP-forming)/AMP-acid ligase II
MSQSFEDNFGAYLFNRLSRRSCLANAATDGVIPAAQVRDRIRKFAAIFAAAGLTMGDRVMIACNVSPASTLAYLGALYAGLVVVPVNERGLAASGEQIFKATGSRAIWTEKLSCDWFRNADILCIEGDCHQLDGDLPSPAPRQADDLAALMPTSGSTGRPRLVKITQGNLIANTQAIIRSQHLSGDERALLAMPINYCFGASVMHTHLWQGGAVFFDSRFMFPDKVLHSISRYRCTTFAGVPTIYNILLQRSNLSSISLMTLRRFLQAGGALAPGRIMEIRTLLPHVDFYVMYGQTEATARIACLPPERLDEKLGSVGLPLDNIRVRITDENGDELDCGKTGEIWVQGKSISPGYLDEPEETAGKFRNGWLATGDIASRDDEGYLWIVGRKSEFVKMRGIRVSLAEIEARAEAASGVAECAATPVSHAEAGEAVALYIVTKQASLDTALLRRTMPIEWVVDSVNVVPELPRNPHGKLLRSQLTEMATSLGHAESKAE